MEKIIDVCEISKTYSKEGSQTSFREVVMNRWNRLFSPVPGKPKATITALADLSFSLEPGDVLGIIGSNGAGKSTLLKILAGIVKPSSGDIYFRGSLLSILDFGTGFHPDLTGRENILLNASLLGMKRAALMQQYDAIVSFSELGDFIHEPVKRYSTGMYLRLAFSVFSHLHSDILLLDEVISVGDFAFRQKCQDRISFLANAGTTIILVSHYPDQVRFLCNKCLWLDKGKKMAFGKTGAVLDLYLGQHILSPGSANLPGFNEPNSYKLSWPGGLAIKDEVLIYACSLKAKNKSNDAPILMADDLEIEIEFVKLQDKAPVEISLSVCSIYEAWVLVESYGLYSAFDKQVVEKGRYRCTCIVPGGILNFGTYQLGLMVSKEEQLIYQQASLLNFTVHYQDREGVKSYLAQGSKSIVQPSGNWKLVKISE